MIKLIFITVFFFLLNSIIFAQNIAITDDDTYTANPSAMLDVKSINKGVLLPRLTTAQRNLVSNPATGLLVFDTDENNYYFYNGTTWVNVSSGAQVWNQNGSQVHLADPNNNVGVGTNNPQNKFIVKGDSNTGPNEAIFAVVSPFGDTLFAVYPDGTRVYVNDSPAKATGSKGGFAVGGFSPAKGAITNEYLRVTPDSVRVYVEENPVVKATGSKGGFAVGGFSPAKAQTFDSLFLFSDRTGLNVSFLTEAERNAIVNPRLSSIIFNTSDSCLQIYLGRWESIWCTTLNCVNPVVLTDPIDQTPTVDGQATFIVSTIGTRLNLYWQESRDGGTTWITLGDGGSGPTYSGTRNDTLVISNITKNMATYLYRCYIYNTCGNATSGFGELLPRIGDNYKGGILAYILQNGDPGYVYGEFHGLVVASIDQSTSIEWGCQGTNISTNTIIGSGTQNTNLITTNCASSNIAARLCLNLTLNGLADWFLPSKDELYKIYLNRNLIGGFSNEKYWASSGSGNNFAYYVNFSNGSQNTDYKSTLNYVRAIRSF